MKITLIWAWRPSYQQLMGLLIWIGGVIATIIGSWIASKIRIYHDNRKVHLDELKEKVLAPVREGLLHNFGAAVSQQVPLLVAQWAHVAFDERAKVTEEPTVDGEVLLAPFPTSKVFGPIPSALLQDAKKNHFSKLMARIDGFLSKWGAHVGLWHVWATRLSREILKQSGLNPYPTKGPTTQSYVMHQRLALFVCNRLVGFGAYPLTIEPQSAVCILRGADVSLAFGSREKIEALIALLDQLIETERPHAMELRSKATALQEEFNKICNELDYALASRRPWGRCDLVTFF